MRECIFIASVFVCAVFLLGLLIYPSWKQAEASEKACHDLGGARVKVMGGYECIIKSKDAP